MAVQITDPPNNGQFPSDQGWAATVQIDSSDAVSGILMDYYTNLAYPGTGGNPIGPDASGWYTWTVSFTPDGNIQLGDLLGIYCYDAEITGDAASVEDIASQAGIAAAPVRELRQSDAPRAGPPSITISSARLSGTSVSVTVQLTPQTKGGIFLWCAKITGINQNNTRLIQVCPLPPSDFQARSHTFQNIDVSQWTNIYVVAVTHGNHCCPAVRPLKICPRN